MAYNKKDNKYFIASLNALCQYFTDKSRENKFRYYVVIHGKTNGIFQTWIEVVESINGVKTPLFKGFNDFTEALDYARGILGPNYYISPALRQNPQNTPQYNIQKDTDKIITLLLNSLLIFCISFQGKFLSLDILIALMNLFLLFYLIKNPIPMFLS